jgi:RNA polymerase sigma-70 factor (ECF subfamily)
MTINEYNNCVNQYADGVFRFILKNIKDEDRAKDIVQDAFEKLWVKLSEIEVATVKSYLFKTAYNTMIDSIRRDKFTDDFENVNDSDYVTHNNYSDVKDVLNEALSKLNEIQRSVVLLRDYEGYNYDEIGKITGLSESQVKVYIYRARVFLKEYIGNLYQVI